MTFSTPPAWHFLEEKYVPVKTDELSTDPRIPPDAAPFREQNDSNPDPTGEDVWPLARAGVQSVRETPTKLAVGAPNEHPADVKVESCPECGTVTDIDYGPEFGVCPKRETPPAEETFSVPFRVQEFMFEELAPVQTEYLHDLLHDHSDRIAEMARDRFRKGFARYGSAAYRWDAETRLTNVLEELADSVVYLTTGPVE